MSKITSDSLNRDLIRQLNAEIERLKAELAKYRQSNQDHWDHLAASAKNLQYDSQVREGHLDVIRDQRAEIERLKKELKHAEENLHKAGVRLGVLAVQLGNKDRLILALENELKCKTT